MPKASVKDNHHHRQHGSHQQHHNTPNLNFNGLDNSNRVNSNIGNGNNAPPHLQSKDADKRLKRKLRLQEMRCNLMSNKLTELKTALSNKKRQLKISEKRAKNEEKKRRDEEKKMKDMEKEFHRLRRENDQIKDQINSNRNQTIESTSSTSSPTITSQQPRQQPQASTSSLQPSTPNTSSALTNSTKKNKKNKQKKTSVTNVEDSPQVRAEAQKSLVNHVPTPITIGSSNNGIVGKLTVTSSNDLKVNEGASCSGVNTSIISSPCSEIVQTDTSQTSSNVINPNDGAHFLGTSKLEDLFENELMCPICHELYIKPIALNCSHIFCHYCIHLWLSKAHKCPICRTLIYEKAPQNVLENVIDKVVSTMDEDSKKRRADVIKDRPPPSENDRISRHGFRRNLISSVLRGDLDDYGRQSTDSLTDSDSYIHSFASPLVYNGFVDRSDSELDYSSDVPNEEMFGLFHDYGYNDDDDDYYDNQDTGSDHDDDDDEDSTDDNGDNYISDGDDDHHEFNHDFYDHPNYGSDSSFESWEANGWRREDSPITIDSERSSDSEESVTYFGQRPGDNSFYSGSNFDQDDEDDEDEEDEEEEDNEDEEDEEEEDEEDEEEENEEYDDEIDEEDGEEDYDNGDDDDVDGEDYYDEEENDSDFDESENSSPWESMDMTESDSDL